MKKKNSVRLILIIFLLGLLLSACSSANLLYVGSNQNGLIAYKYTLFNSTETQREELSAGQIVNLEYEIKVEKGQVELHVLDPENNSIWKVEADSDLSGSTELTIPADGIYRFEAVGNQAKGSYHFAWE